MSANEIRLSSEEAEALRTVVSVFGDVEIEEAPLLVAARETLGILRRFTMEARLKWGATAPRRMFVYRCSKTSCLSYGVGTSNKSYVGWRCIDCGTKNTLSSGSVIGDSP